MGMNRHMNGGPSSGLLPLEQRGLQSPERRRRLDVPVIYRLSHRLGPGSGRGLRVEPWSLARFYSSDALPSRSAPPLHNYECTQSMLHFTPAMWI
jgi:hypothetical protein